MGLWSPNPLIGRFIESNTATPSSTPGTAVTANTPAGTKTATPVQLIASTAKEAAWVVVALINNNTAATITNVIVDIMIGGAGSETVLIPDLLVGSQPSITTNYAPHYYVFPIRVPAGSRLSCRSASGPAASVACRVQIWLYGKNPKVPSWTGSKVTAYGITSPARGVSVTPGVSAAEGAWTEIVASTTADHEYIVPGIGMPQLTVVVSQVYALDIGYGAAAEVLLGGDIVFMTDTNERVHGGLCLPFYAALPSGSRLVARLSQHAATAQACDIALYGVS